MTGHQTDFGSLSFLVSRREVAFDTLSLICSLRQKTKGKESSWKHLVIKAASAVNFYLSTKQLCRQLALGLAIRQKKASSFQKSELRQKRTRGETINVT
jgi:hypothetical protein